MTLDPDQLDALARRYLELAAQRDDLDRQMEGIKAVLREHYPDGANLDTPCGATINVTISRRFDPALAERTLPGELLALCRVTKVDPAAARKALPPALFESLMSPSGKATVRIQ